MRKRLVILFFAIAQLVILGHGMVLHHHHDDIIGTAHKHHHHDNEDKTNHHADENPLERAFSGFFHSGEVIIFTVDNSTQIVINKNKVKSVVALSIDYQTPIKKIIACQKHIFPPDRQFIYKSPHSTVHRLRGPPDFIVV